LILSVIKQRSIKSKEEIAEIELALDVTAEMHKIAMKNTRHGETEQSIVGKIEGYALEKGRRMAYPVIFTVNGEILHNNIYKNTMESGQLALNDSGSESPMYYASDITRTFPVSGTFSDIQKQIYNLVYEMQEAALDLCKPGISYKDAHMASAKKAVEGLIEIGIMSGDPNDAVAEGAHALFFPHGLGHMLGLDVHDMEGLGEDLVGYDSKVNRSDQFGLAYLRLSKELYPGFVLTVEPGIYFIPHLIDQWEGSKKHSDFINYSALDKFKNFGGIRIEDNIIITDDSYRMLGPHIPKTVNEIESIMNS
jgi:Xaa-Pro aminopeptidase